MSQHPVKFKAKVNFGISKNRRSFNKDFSNIIVEITKSVSDINAFFSDSYNLRFFGVIVI